MKSYIDLLEKTRVQACDISEKLEVLKRYSVNADERILQDNFQDTYNKLERINREIQFYCNKLNNTNEGENENVKRSELQKNIYTTVHSHSNAYRKAGGLFKRYKS